MLRMVEAATQPRCAATVAKTAEFARMFVVACMVRLKRWGSASSQGDHVDGPTSGESLKRFETDQHIVNHEIENQVS